LKAVEDGRVVVSADTDFANLLALAGSQMPSLILFRRGTDRHPSKQLRLLLDHLADLKEALTKGAVVVFDESRIRIRELPIIPPGATRP
jgi:predicted nuclease of predicted toxin-antitoxin system